MSYDLFVRPSRRNSAQRTLLPSRSEVEKLLEAMPEVRRAGEAGYEIDANSGGLIQISLGTEAGDRVRQIEIVVSCADDDLANQLWQFCARTARALGWKIFDPQADAWYTPGQLVGATKGALDVLLIVVVVGALIAFGGMAGMLAGGQRSWSWVGLVWIGLLTAAAGRVLGRRRFRE